MSDTELDSAVVRRVRAGDSQAYTEIVRRHQHRLRSALSFYCISAEEVEEILQDAFVQAFAHLDQFDEAAPFFPWLKTIALNTLRMAARKRETARRGALDYLLRLQMARAESDPNGEARVDALHKCLSELPKPQAELLVAKYQKLEPMLELAKRQNVTETAMKVRLLRLREALRACIQRRLGAIHG